MKKKRVLNNISISARFENAGIPARRAEKKTLKLSTKLSTRTSVPGSNRIHGYERFRTLVELQYISCKNLAEVVHIRHYLRESCKNLRFETNLSDSGRSDFSCRFRRVPYIPDIFVQIMLQFSDSILQDNV